MDFHNFLRDAIKAKKIPVPSPQPYKYPPIGELLPGAFYRRGLADALKEIQRLFPTAEFFVFSAGQRHYVEQMVKLVEEHTGVHFNRPLFSREDCTFDETRSYRKSIEVQLPRMIASLAKTYPALKKPELVEEVLANHLVFVDDNDVVWDLKDKWIPCPTYNYVLTLDPTSGVAPSVMNHAIVRTYQRSANVGFVEPEEMLDDERNLMYHTYMADFYRHALSFNKDALQDDFFARLVAALKPLHKLKRPFASAQVAKLRKALDAKK